MNPGQKFLALAGFLFSLAVVYRVAPGHAILFGLLLLAVAYVVVMRRGRR